MITHARAPAIVALGVVAAASVPYGFAWAQPAVMPVAVETCGAPWASFDVLAPVLRVELRSVAGEADVVRAGDDTPPVLWIEAPDCAVPTSLRIVARRAGRQLERTIELADVPEPARSRTIALVVVDVIAAVRDAAPMESPPDPPNSLASPEPAGPEDARRSSDRSVAPRERAVATAAGSRSDPAPPPSAETSLVDRSPRRVDLFLLGEATVATAGDVFWGARAGVDLPLAPVDALSAGAALGVSNARNESTLGTIDLLVLSLALSVDASAVLGPVSIGGGLAARPGIVLASASPAAEGVIAKNETDFVLDVEAFVRVRFSIAPPLSLRLDAGIAYATRGYEALAGATRAVGLTSWLVPIRAGLAWSL